ncbi:zinc finger BED domain-containing protein RICESLEEPER 2 [Tanacetum coccineum]
MSPVITCAAALNLCFNVSGVELLIESITTDLECFDDGFTTKAKERFNSSLEGLYNIYYLKYGNPTQSSNAASSSSEQRIREYVQSDFVSHLSTEELAGYDVSGFWRAKESTFPVLSQMTLDVLSVQATSVAFESTFSTSGRVISIRRTRLTPASLETCMCLKDHLDATDRIQHTSNLENSLDFEAEILKEEVLEHEAIALSDEEIALDEAASEARSNGSGGEEFDMILCGDGTLVRSSFEWFCITFLLRIMRRGHEESKDRQATLIQCNEVSINYNMHHRIILLFMRFPSDGKILSDEDKATEYIYINRPLKTIARISGGVYIPRGVCVPDLDEHIL